MKILLTGGSGFIGRNIIEQLGSKYHILAPRHKELDLLNEDDVRSFFQSHSIDVVIHSAVKPGHRNSADNSQLCYNNLRMFYNLARNEDFFDKMIFLSSGAAYDVSKDLLKVREEDFDTNVPGDEHGFSKYISAKYVEKSEKITELRLFGIFGKYEDYSIRFISNVICKALYNIPISIKQNRKFDYVYIDDFITILDSFISERYQYKVYNVTPDQSIELYEIAKMVLNIIGENLPINVASPGLGKEYSGANDRLQKELKDKGICFSSLNESIRKLVEWYKQNVHEIDRQLLLFDK
ncbi:NAD-dependent epimerase/dehydratase family protein [Paenibacillus sp. GCM10027626]|uniref:NAD-dependent epimerase/dehydratase family protein n=1 Tax=Paenibacillus sp. GCM10027626 TaxID=3273411 RepID=UPI003645BF5D